MQRGISPLIGEEGRAIQASIAHLPPDQQHQQLTIGAQNGLYSFPVALALQAALKLNPPAQNPPPGTVVGDMIQQLAGGQPAAPQMPMPQGAPAQPAPGLAGLPVSNIGTQAMAGGGIVAFSKGDLVESDEKRFSDWLASMENSVRQTPASRLLTSPEARAALAKQSRKESPYFLGGYDYSVPPASEGISGEGTESLEGNPAADVIPKSEVAPSAAPAGPAAPGGASGLMSLMYSASPEFQQALKEANPGVKPDETAERDKALKEFDAAGMGGALTKRIEALAAREAKDKERFAKEGRWNVAKGFFEAAAEAGQPGATLLGSLSRGAANYAGAKSQMSDKIEAAKAALEDQQFAVESAKEELNFKRTESAKAAYDKALARYDAQRTQYLTLLSQQENMQSRYAASVAKAQAKAAGGVDKLGGVIGPDLAEAATILKAAQATGDPEQIAAATAYFQQTTSRSNDVAAAWQGLISKQAQAVDAKVVDTIQDNLTQPDSQLAIIRNDIMRLAKKGVKDDADLKQLQRLQKDYSLEMVRIEQEVRDNFAQQGIGNYSAPAVGGEGWAIVPDGAK
jgi:hypothetical protein